MITFNDVTNERLFGAEDAEYEDTERFKEYFFSNRTYENLIADMSIRILVGHKGIGKSALLRRAYLDDEENSKLSVWVRPNDLISHVENTDRSDFNRLIENWKTGLINAIIEKFFTRIGQNSDINKMTNVIRGSARLLIDTFKSTLREKQRFFADELNRNIVENFLDSEMITVYIDDIDRGWDASYQSIRNISAMLNAIRDLSGSDQRLKFRIGLRTDVYFLVRTSDESTDKIERHVIWLSWTNHEILAVIAKRIVTYFGNARFLEDYDQNRILNLDQNRISREILSSIMVSKFRGKGHWGNRSIHHVLLSLTRRRPRDLVKLLHSAARNAYNNHESIETIDFEKSFEPYSLERLQDTINEFSSELPQIRSLLLGMAPTKRERRTSSSFLFSTDELVKKMREIIDHSSLHFTNRTQVEPRSLIQFLYKIDFITARKN